MKGMTRWSTFAVLALAMFAFACEGESPTIPAPETPGQQPPPTGQVTVTVAVSNPSPLVNSTTTITATVSQNNQTVPDGTAVEFQTNLGTFAENNSATVLRITTGGVATATLTSATAGDATVVVRVGSVVRTAAVTFRPQQVEPIPPETAPQITSIDPTTGKPSGGDLVTITGKNFATPVRVLFGNQAATVISASATQIRVATPAINLTAAEQRREVTVQVINQAGTPDERSVNAPQPFVYELEILTPTIGSISPSSGPNEGNTRITISGDGFQPPTRVFFGTGAGAGGLINQVELEVLTITFNSIIAMTPPALGLGAPLRDQQVTIRVLNVVTNLETTLPNAFRYGPTMEITDIAPKFGTALGGTRLTIFGWGFDDPVSVTVAGVSAQPVRVSGTEIVAITGGLLSPCTTVAGNVVVKNIEDGASDIWGDAADEVPFDYIGTQPTIVAVAPNPATAGSPVTISVLNPGIGPVRFQIGASTVLPTPSSASIGTGVTDFVVTVPANITFTEEACTDAAGRVGLRFVPTTVSITFTNTITNCTDTLGDGLTINPTDLSCRVPPEAVTPTTTVAFSGPCGGASTPDQPYLVTNAGGTNLIITGVNSSLPNFQVISPVLPQTVTPGGSVTFMLRINPLPAATPVPSPTTGTISIVSNDPTPPTPTPATMTCP